MIRPRFGLGWLRLVAAFITLLLVAGSAWLGPLQPIDQALRTARFAATDRPPSGDTVFVEVDAESLAAFGVWPWPRSIHANALDRLMELGAAEVVFDMDFSTASSPEGDLALEQALERAGGYAYLAAFQQTTVDGKLVLNSPIARFAQHSAPVLVNVDGDGTRLLRSVPLGLASQGIPSVARALAPSVPASGPALTIDFGIDLGAVPRVSVAELLRGNIDPAFFLNKQVIVGASAVELRDFFRVPRFGVIPGPLVQVAATETLKTNRNLTDLAAWPTAALIGLALISFLACAQRLALPHLVLLCFVVSTLVEVAAWLALRDAKVVVDTACFHLTAILLVLSVLIEERAERWKQYVRQQERIAYLARHEPESGARNRHALLDDLNHQLSTIRAGTIIAMNLGRLDGAIGSLGHEVGEQVASEVMRRLEKLLGEKPARISVDLFAWSYPEALNAEQQVTRALQVASAVDVPYHIDGHVIILETSFGSSSTTNGADHAGELLRQADVALKRALESNSKAIAFAPEQSARIAQRRLRDIALREALLRDEFHLLFQPQVDLASGSLLGVEALVRWRSEALGQVSPVDFIPLAEETGLIVQLGDWVLQEACRQAAQWQWVGRLSVNVSAVQFQLGDVVASVDSALARSGFPANRLDIEITESLFVENDPKILSALEALRRRGVGIALDDFGTGYSSLSYLSRLPVDKIKIDQSFVRSLPDRENEAIVEAILFIAKRLGKTVIAEGIETVAQRDYLTNLACEVGQGYLFGKPTDAQTIGLVSYPQAAA